MAALVGLAGGRREKGRMRSGLVALVWTDVVALLATRARDGLGCCWLKEKEKEEVRSGGSVGVNREGEGE